MVARKQGLDLGQEFEVVRDCGLLAASESLGGGDVVEVGDLVTFKAGAGQIVGGIFDGAVSRGLERGTIVAEFENLGAGDLAQREAIAKVARFEGESSEGDLVQQ